MSIIFTLLALTFFTLISKIPLNFSTIKNQDFKNSANKTINNKNSLQNSNNRIWNSEGIAIYTAINGQIDPQIYPQICPDGQGGAIIAWDDGRSGNYYDIYVQRVDSEGVVKWTPNGVAVCALNSNQFGRQICSDGQGGAIITWVDERNGKNYDIYAQRVDSMGILKWTSNGVAVCAASDNQDAPRLCSDEQGGAIIIWQDRRNGKDLDMYAQRVDSMGILKWTINGIAISTANNNQWASQICPDGQGGAIIVWSDTRSGTEDIYAQLIDSMGNSKWVKNGVAVCTANDIQAYRRISSDGQGGAIIVWQDKRKGIDYDIYAQHIKSNGNMSWKSNGIVVCAANNDQKEPHICPDGQGGTIITWYDKRSGKGYDIYAQRVNSNGNMIWISNGIVVTTVHSVQNEPQICSDGQGGAIIVWYDHRSSYDNIYAQRIDSTGKENWTTNGIAVCSTNNRCEYPQICSDERGGVIVTWNDYRNGKGEIYAQHLNSIEEFEPTNLTLIFLIACGIVITLVVLGALAYNRSRIKILTKEEHESKKTIIEKAPQAKVKEPIIFKEKSELRQTEEITKESVPTPSKAIEEVTEESVPIPFKAIEEVTEESVPTPSKVIEEVTKESVPAPSKTIEEVTKESVPKPSKAIEEVSEDKFVIKPQELPEIEKINITDEILPAKSLPTLTKMDYNKPFLVKDINITQEGNWTIENDQSVYLYKVKAENNSEYVISNIHVMITSTPSGFHLISERLISFADLNKDTFVSPTFKFAAKKRSVGNKIKAIINFRDYKGKTHTILVKPLKIQF